MVKSSPEKLARERARYRRLTPEQKAAVIERERIRAAHLRASDESYLTKKREYTRQQYHKHRATRIVAMQDKHWKTRLACLCAYSADPPFCACCGEDILEFLTLDHLVDKRSDGGVRVGGDRVGQSLYAWLIRMQFPAGFRVLCFNCNCALGNRGYCPHEIRLDAAIQEMTL